MTPQARRHLRRDGDGRQSADGLAHRLADVGVKRVLEDVRVESRRRRRRRRVPAARLLFQHEPSGTLPGQRDKVNVLLGVENSPLTFRRTSFSAAATSGSRGSSGRVGFLDQDEIFRPLGFVSPGFVQRHADHIEGRAGLRNLKSKSGYIKCRPMKNLS